MLYVLVLGVFMIFMFFYASSLFRKIKQSSHSDFVKGLLYILAGAAIGVFFLLGFVFIMLGFYRPNSK